jgi:hypothetical protein
MKTILCSVFLSALALSIVHLDTAQAFKAPQLSTEAGVYLTRYRVAGQSPKTVVEFDHFILNEASRDRKGEISTDAEGNVPIKGELQTKTGRTYGFRTGLLRKVKHGFRGLTFATDSVDGISYRFSGAFLDKARQIGTQFVWLEGTLIKYKDKVAVSSARLRLYQSTQQ